jgi:hypothetical protein
MHSIPQILFKLLRQIDAEAVPNASGAPTVLNNTRQTEPAWSKRLVELCGKKDSCLSNSLPALVNSCRTAIQTNANVFLIG